MATFHLRVSTLFLPLACVLFCHWTHVQAQEEQVQHAVSLTQAGRLPEAEVAWKKLARAKSKDASIHAALGQVLAQEGKLEEAVAEYRRSLELDPHQPDVSLNLGLAEFKRGKFAEAIAPLLVVHQQRPGEARVGVLLGMSYYGARAYAKAVPYLQTALTGDSANQTLHSILAESCLFSGQFDCAMAEYKSMLTTDPNSAQSHMLMAQALDGMNRAPEAVRELEEAARLSPDEPNVHFELGYLYYVAHDYVRAAPQFELELKHNPDHAQACAYLGDLKLRTNDAAAAELLLLRALHLQNDTRMAWFDLGKIYSEEKKNPEALSALLKAESLDPAEPDAHYRLARLYTAMGEKEKASLEYAKTKELHSKAADTLVQQISGGDRQPQP